jgi:hypothetical protein
VRRPRLPLDARRALGRRHRQALPTEPFALSGAVRVPEEVRRQMHELERGAWNALQEAGKKRRLEGPPVPPLPSTALQATYCNRCGQWVAGEFHGCTGST